MSPDFSGVIDSAFKAHPPNSSDVEFGDAAFVGHDEKKEVVTKLSYVRSAMAFYREKPNIGRHLNNMSLGRCYLRKGTSSGKKVRINATTNFVVGGRLVRKSPAEVAFTATEHDIAANREAQFLISVAINNDAIITKGSEGPTGSSPKPIEPPGAATFGIVKIACGSSGFNATTDLLNAAHLTVEYTDYAFLPESEGTVELWSDGVIANSKITFERESSGESGLAFYYILIGQ